MKSKSKKLKKNKDSFWKSIIYLILSQVFIKIVGLLYKLFLTNKEGFGDTGNAIYSGGFQIYALLLTFSSTGVPNAISKLVAERLAVGDSKGAHKIFCNNRLSWYNYFIFRSKNNFSKFNSNS